MLYFLDGMGWEDRLNDAFFVAVKALRLKVKRQSLPYSTS